MGTNRIAVATYRFRVVARLGREVVSINDTILFLTHNWGRSVLFHQNDNRTEKQGRNNDDTSCSFHSRSTIAATSVASPRRASPREGTRRNHRVDAFVLSLVPMQQVDSAMEMMMRKSMNEKK